MKRIFWIVLCLLVISCTPGSGTRSNSQIFILSITNTDGGHTITSDVVTNNSVFDDKGIINLQTATYNLDMLSTVYTDVTVDQLDISYSRSDGKNIPGKDVPYGYSLPVSQLIPIGISVALTDIVMVRHIAKIEPPLFELRDYSQENVLYLNCKVTVQARDGAGKRLKPVTGSIQIQCANFAD